MQLSFILIIALSSIFALSADKRPWYRSKRWQERRIEKEVKRQNSINWHKDEIVKGERELRSINQDFKWFKKEVKEIPCGSIKRKELLVKLDERRQAEESTQRQQLASYLLQHKNKHVSQALWQNTKTNSPIKQQRLKEEMNKIKSENTIDPTLAPIHDQHYDTRERALEQKKWGKEDFIEHHKKELETLQQKASKKRRFWKWPSISGSHRN